MDTNTQRFQALPALKWIFFVSKCNFYLQPSIPRSFSGFRTNFFVSNFDETTAALISDMILSNVFAFCVLVLTSPFIGDVNGDDDAVLNDAIHIAKDAIGDSVDAVNHLLDIIPGHERIVRRSADR